MSGPSVCTEVELTNANWRSLFTKAQETLLGRTWISNLQHLLRLLPHIH